MLSDNHILKLYKSGRLRVKDRTVYFDIYNDKGDVIDSKKRPIETYRAIYIFGQVDITTSFINFISKSHSKVLIFIFNYYGNFSALITYRSIMESPKVFLKQVEHYSDKSKKDYIAREFLIGGQKSIINLVKQYNYKNPKLSNEVKELEASHKKLIEKESFESGFQLMSYESMFRRKYYSLFDSFLIKNSDFNFQKRSYNPPLNELNALVSFLNSLVYVEVINALYLTQINQTISFLHALEDKRYSLAYDISEVFKPILADTLFFKLINKKMLNLNHFEYVGNACFLNDDGRKIVVKEFEAKILDKVKKLEEEVSYREIIKRECYKLKKHFISKEKYRAFFERF